MPTATRNGADRVLHEQLRDVRQEDHGRAPGALELQRERERDAAREAFAHVGRGERAARELNECHDRLKELADEGGALLGTSPGVERRRELEEWRSSLGATQADWRAAYGRPAPRARALAALAVTLLSYRAPGGLPKGGTSCSHSVPGAGVTPSRR